MGDDELNELRKRRLAQLQQQAGDQQAMQEELERQQRAKSQIQMVLMSILEPDAGSAKHHKNQTRFCSAVEQQSSSPERASQEEDQRFRFGNSSASCAKRRDYTIKE
jgi:hypothetical protein